MIVTVLLLPVLLVLMLFGLDVMEHRMFPQPTEPPPADAEEPAGR
ncbi:MULTISPECIES: hypothetical protein [Streptomyces]|nr:hypothetical protein [Streptomyces lasalocidi]